MQINPNSSSPSKREMPAPAAPAPEAAAPADRVTLGSGVVPLRILHMNDLHGAVEDDGARGGIARASTLLQQERDAVDGHALTLNAGDIADGSLVSYLTKGKVVTEALNEMAFDAIELGNHDFLWGQSTLGTMVEGLDAPVLGANVMRQDEGRPLTEGWMMREVNGVKVAVIGVDTPDMERFTGPDRIAGLRFDGPADAVKRALPEVRAQGAEVVVVLSHLGFAEDKKLVEAVPGIDLIVGGHSHTELPSGERVGDTLIVQAGSEGQFVGEVDLAYDRASRRVTSAEARLVPVTTATAADPRVQSIVDRCLGDIEEVANRVVGQATEELHFSHKEAAMLNQMHSDSIRAATGAELAITSARNLRGTLPAGDVRYKDVFEAFPMTGEEVVVMQATGRMLVEEIEDRVGDGGRGVLVPAGFSYTYDPKLPSGHRVTEARMDDGRPLVVDKVYTVATTGTTARKKTFKEAQERREAGNSQDIFVAWVTQGSPWRDAPDDRVRRAEG